jgi:hypothetical protein
MLKCFEYRLSIPNPRHSRPSSPCSKPPPRVKKVFDLALAATRKDNGVTGLYTVNVDDSKDFAFLQVENPIA